ncbi:MAG TPA: hypothetical protein VLH10_07095 [Yinghuangia sp.]|uniref:hypothetical protein n=1 Tax=Yinghuangia sp. YIM S10712 TaxID=3436930 RepID=UPI002BFD0288|nr:hypothetical protein [Yinghuangia sp.]
MDEIARRTPEVGTGPAEGRPRPGPRPADGSDALEWRERDRERACLLLERVGDIARRMERACGHLVDGPLPIGGHVRR